MHRHAQLVLRLVEITKLGRVAAVYVFRTGTFVKRETSISLVSLSPIGLRNSFPKPAHNSGAPELFVGKVLQAHVLGEGQRRLISDATAR